MNRNCERCGTKIVQGGFFFGGCWYHKACFIKHPAEVKKNG